ncbi:RDD family protein [Bacillus sp. FJAT-42376]|uniref:RDD family protein n=1 Tax=Bacillus sp. FJAT-42376 TaxID=2014076 RepID=UPI000F4DF5FD|nr:RDD family protein [Bacillus sp. FJAT-42376]AZB41882.1 RDD family protein [Bacillus sp. FJAT-42376]
MEKNPAGFWIRLGANLIDGVLFAIIGYLLTLLVGETIGQNTTSGIQFFYGLLLPIFWYGYTVGKRAVKVRIVKVNGQGVTFWTMIKRTVISGILYGLPAIIGAVIALSLSWSEFIEIMSNPLETAPEPSNSLIAAFAVLFGGMLLSLIVLAASAIMMGVREDKRSIHDLIAGTYVTRNLPNEPVQTEWNEAKEI